MVMASDGLFDKLSNEQVVDLVGRWLNTHDTSQAVPPPDLAKAPSLLTPRKIPSKITYDPKRTYDADNSANEKYFVVKDENAATHLVRNALGGGDEDMLCGMLTASAPIARDMR